MAVERISELYLIPALNQMIESFPFVIRNFHSDCGSEYINRQVAEMLDKLRIEQTKSRARQCNDNALVESKNAATVRKYLGYAHIPAPLADAVSEFTRGVLSPYLNYHRPCFFAHETQNAKGKIRKQYRYEDMMTPYEKFKSLPRHESYLKPGVILQELDAMAVLESDKDWLAFLHPAATERHAASDVAFHAAHHAEQIAFLEFFHHFLHLLELSEHLVDVLNITTGTLRNALLAGGIDDIRL